MVSKKKKKKKERTIQQELGIRLDTPAPIVFEDKTKYNRKDKHKKEYSDDATDSSD